MKCWNIGHLHFQNGQTNRQTKEGVAAPWWSLNLLFSLNRNRLCISIPFLWRLGVSLLNWQLHILIVRNLWVITYCYMMQYQLPLFSNIHAGSVLSRKQNPQQNRKLSWQYRHFNCLLDNHLSHDSSSCFSLAELRQQIPALDCLPSFRRGIDTYRHLNGS